tara:strand:- start:4 stop:387 length:384 start_codon:yes stop_codon:yes gene_type:complete
MLSILVKDYTNNEETVPLDLELHKKIFMNSIPLTVSNDGHKRQLAPDVMALLSKAYSRYRMAVRQADGFIEECDVPPVTITSIRDSRGQDWEASITYGHNIRLYKNWCGEEFPIVFEKKREYIVGDL